MRKITQQAINALIYGDNFGLSNTAVNADTFGETAMFLHGNKILYKKNGDILFCLCAWNTPTTRERINGFLSRRNMKIHTKKGKLFISSTLENNKKTIEINEFSTYSIDELKEKIYN